MTRSVHITESHGPIQNKCLYLLSAAPGLSAGLLAFQPLFILNERLKEQGNSEKAEQELAKMLKLISSSLFERPELSVGLNATPQA